MGNLPGLSRSPTPPILAGTDFSLPVFLSVPVAPEITRFHLNYNRESALQRDALTGADFINSVYRSANARTERKVSRGREGKGISVESPSLSLSPYLRFCQVTLSCQNNEAETRRTHDRPAIPCFSPQLSQFICVRRNPDMCSRLEKRAVHTRERYPRYFPTGISRSSLSR